MNGFEQRPTAGFQPSLRIPASQQQRAVAHSVTFLNRLQEVLYVYAPLKGFMQETVDTLARQGARYGAMQFHQDLDRWLQAQAATSTGDWQDRLYGLLNYSVGNAAHPNQLPYTLYDRTKQQIAFKFHRMLTEAVIQDKGETVIKAMKKQNPFLYQSIKNVGGTAS